jgi:hypothetical protein
MPLQRCIVVIADELTGTDDDEIEFIEYALLLSLRKIGSDTNSVLQRILDISTESDKILKRDAIQVSFTRFFSCQLSPSQFPFLISKINPFPRKTA